MPSRARWLRKLGAGGRALVLTGGVLACLALAALMAHPSASKEQSVPEARAERPSSLDAPRVREVLDRWARGNAARRKDHPA